MDRTDIVRKLFRIESNKDELKLRGFSYTELEFTDLMDMVAILDRQGVYELYEYCPGALKGLKSVLPFQMV